MRGRKRHILVDAMGNLLELVITGARDGDRAGLLLLLERLGARFPRLYQVWADPGYAGKKIRKRVADEFGLELEISNPPIGSRHFVPVTGRWVVERSFGWLGRSRRLSKDYEHYPATSEGFIWLSETSRLLRRLTQPI